MRHFAAWILMFLLSACAAPAPFVHPSAAGKPVSEVSRLIAASEAKQFPCNVLEAKGAGVADDAGLVGHRSPEATLLPGRYRVTLHCTNGFHEFKPKVDVVARAGKSYRLTGYLVDDSITIFTMRMRVKVAELP